MRTAQWPIHNVLADGLQTFLKWFDKLKMLLSVCPAAPLFPQDISSILADVGAAAGDRGMAARGWGCRKGLWEREQGSERVQRPGTPGWVLTLWNTTTVGIASVAAASRGLIALSERQQPLFSPLHGIPARKMLRVSLCFSVFPLFPLGSPAA